MYFSLNSLATPPLSAGTGHAIEGMALIFGFTLFFTTFSSLTSVFAAELPSQQKLMTLADRRTQSPELVGFPKTSPEERKFILRQTKWFISSFFAHLLVKQERYKGIDPDRDFDLISEKIETLTDEEFYLSIVRVVQSLRDRHTLFSLPKPFSCYKSHLGIGLKRVLEGNKFVVAISNIKPDADFQALSPDLKNIQVGDIIERFDGVTVLDALKEKNLLFEGGGANISAEYSKAISLLPFLNHQFRALPKINPSHPDTVQLNMRRNISDSNSITYQVNLPWISLLTPDCLPKETSSKKEELPQIPKNTAASVDLFGIEFWNDKNHDFTFKTLSRDNKTFGYIRISKFDGDYIDRDIKAIAEILTTKFRDTEGLILDLRDNSGGAIKLSEGLVQLFSPVEVLPAKFRHRLTGGLKSYLKLALTEDKFLADVLEAESKNPRPDYSSGLPISDSKKINNTGRVYFKPVAVLANSVCYSAGDLLAGALQDHGAATIWLQDGRSGGGGANASTYSDMKWITSFKDKNAFPELPYGIEIHISLRQWLRRGANEGKVMEGFGVYPDYGCEIPPTLNDLKNGDSDTIERITTFLEKKSENPQSLDGCKPK